MTRMTRSSRAVTKRLGAGKIALALILTTSASGGAFAVSDNVDQLFELLREPTPEVLAAPTELTVESTSISCYTLPCPYFEVVEPGSATASAVETIVLSIDDWPGGVEPAIQDLILRADGGPVVVVGHVADRARPEGQRASDGDLLQRVLVVVEIPSAQ